MKASSSLALIALSLLVAGSTATRAEEAKAPEIRAMSFNIRNGKAKDGDNRWELREGFVCDIVRDYRPDLLGLQEAYRFQLDVMIERLPEYGDIGTGRDGGSKGEHTSILYLKERFVAHASGTFWLSDTPSKPSASWGNHYKRICTWARFSDKASKQYFYVYNTHLDHQSQDAREKGIQLIMKRIEDRAHPDPFILMGDFNAGENSPPIAYLTTGTGTVTDECPIPLVDSWRAVHPVETTVSTVSRFTGDREGPKIDYIFVTPSTVVSEASILRTNRNGRYPSDHYPVTAQLRFKEIRSE